MSTATPSAAIQGARSRISGAPASARAILLVIVATAGIAGFLATDADTSARAVAAAGADLTRLLRAMAGLKLVMAALVVAAAYWRLRAPIGPTLLCAYAVACGSMTAGAAMIWRMEHVGAGAVLLHGGLLAAIVVLWRDPAVGELLRTAVAARRSAVARFDRR